AAFPADPAYHASIGVQQISIVLWTIWHVSFPAIVAMGLLRPGRTGRVFDERKIRRETIAVLGAVAIACVAMTDGVVVFRDHLPHLIEHGRLTPLFLEVVAPAI